MPTRSAYARVRFAWDESPAKTKHAAANVKEYQRLIKLGARDIVTPTHVERVRNTYFGRACFLLSLEWLINIDQLISCSNCSALLIEQLFLFMKYKHIYIMY